MTERRHLYDIRYTEYDILLFMNLLVTGGAGFIGSHFVLEQRRLHPEEKLIVLDKLTYAADRLFLAQVEGEIIFVQGDIADQSLVEELITKHHIDAIVNFAAETHVDRSIDDASPFLHTNIIGVQSLIQAAKAHPQLLLYHVSTDEVYGDQQDDEPTRKETDTLHPSSPYAASKAAADLLLLASARTYGIRVRISRCTNNYGPHQASEKFMPMMIHAATHDQKLPLYGNGRNKRDWLFVTDHCDAIDFLLRREGIDGSVFNVSAHDERENIDVAKMILRILGKSEALLSFVADRPGHDWRYAVDSSAMRALGWKPRVSFEEGLSKTVEWYRKVHS